VLLTRSDWSVLFPLSFLESNHIVAHDRSQQVSGVPRSRGGAPRRDSSGVDGVSSSSSIAAVHVLMSSSEAANKNAVVK